MNMNWYIKAQIQEKWKKFPPNAQREFPFMHEPGYNRKAYPYLEEKPDYDMDYNLYHVTTNLSGVIQVEKLKSRKELGGVVGLGGGVTNEASNLISVTYSYNKALSIYNDLKIITEVVSGRISALTVFNSFDFDDGEIENLDIALGKWVDDEIIEKYVKGEINYEQFEKIIDEKITGAENVYALWQGLEKVKIDSAMKDMEYSMDFIDYGISGFTGSFEDMKKINPSQIAILQLVARKGAEPEHVVMELELRFKPEDLKVVRYLQPK